MGINFSIVENENSVKMNLSEGKQFVCMKTIFFTSFRCLQIFISVLDRPQATLSSLLKRARYLLDPAH
jgi:hypothetical protein